VESDENQKNMHTAVSFAKGSATDMLPLVLKETASVLQTEC
jgi:hypothetical protein